MKITLYLIGLFITNLSIAQNRFSIVIDEIMADPSPAISLPPNEWIELKNVSQNPVNLQNWRFCDANAQSGPFPFFVLEPDSFVILCNTSSYSLMQQYGRVIPVTSFPSLDNDGDLLFLKNSNGMIIHALEFTKDWYNNPIKSDGGWTLEMIDTRSPCSGIHNWKASSDLSGGTPGRRNALDNINPDTSPPRLLRSYTTDSVTIILVFSEPIDSLKASALQNYTINNGPSINMAIPLNPLFQQVKLIINNALSAGIIYEVSVSNITDCVNNPIGGFNKCKVALPQGAQKNDVVINEILYDPLSGNNDFIEIYNRSNKVMDLRNLYLATRSLSGSLNSPRQISPLPFYFYPFEYLVITTDANELSLNYFVLDPERVITNNALPSFPNEEGTIVLLNLQGQIIDEVNYKDDWHFPLLTQSEGVSLERIDPNGESNNSNNWHSAASAAGNGTPGYKNSQYLVIQATSTISIEPEIISPDNDGKNDFLTIRYKISEPGYVGNIHIYDVYGRMKRYLLNNALLGIEGTLKWDGLGDNQTVLAGGIYIMVTDLFNMRGKTQRFKTVVVVAKKNN